MHERAKTNKGEKTFAPIRRQYSLTINHLWFPYAYAYNIRQSAILGAILAPHGSCQISFESIGLHLGFGLVCDSAWGGFCNGCAIACQKRLAVPVAVGEGVTSGGGAETPYIIASGCACHISRRIAINGCATALISA